MVVMLRLYSGVDRFKIQAMLDPCDFATGALELICVVQSVSQSSSVSRSWPEVGRVISGEGSGW